jgi:hypothetical protein
MQTAGFGGSARRGQFVMLAREVLPDSVTPSAWDANLLDLINNFC